MNKEQLAESREVDYRLSKWIITNIEQLLSPEEIEEIWRELLSFYSPPTASVENVCGTMTGNGLGKYVVPSKSDMIVDEYAQEAGDQDGYRQEDQHKAAVRLPGLSGCCIWSFRSPCRRLRPCVNRSGGAEWFF